MSEQLRRADRAVEDLAEIEAILSRCQIGRLGLVSQGEPYVVPLHFAHLRQADRLAIYFHGAGEGRKLEAIGAGAWACFEADRRIALVDHAKACRIGATFESVIGWGEVAVCADPAEALAALAALLDKYAPGRSAELAPRDAALATVLRLTLARQTAKQRL